MHIFQLSAYSFSQKMLNVNLLHIKSPLIELIIATPSAHLLGLGIFTANRVLGLAIGLVLSGTVLPASSYLICVNQTLVLYRILPACRSDERIRITKLYHKLEIFDIILLEVTIKFSFTQFG